MELAVSLNFWSSLLFIMILEVNMIENVTDSNGIFKTMYEESMSCTYNFRGVHSNHKVNFGLV